MAPPIRTRPSFPLSQSLPSGSFHKPLILLHQRADRLKTRITENQPIWSHGPQSNSMKLWAMPCRATRDGEFWQNVVHWRREWQTTSVFLPWELHEQYEDCIALAIFRNIIAFNVHKVSLNLCITIIIIPSLPVKKSNLAIPRYLF